MCKKAYKSHVYKSAIYYTVNTSLKLPPRFKKKKRTLSLVVLKPPS